MSLSAAPGNPPYSRRLRRGASHHSCGCCTLRSFCRPAPNNPQKVAEESSATPRLSKTGLPGCCPTSPGGGAPSAIRADAHAGDAPNHAVQAAHRVHRRVCRGGGGAAGAGCVGRPGGGPPACSPIALRCAGMGMLAHLRCPTCPRVHPRRLAKCKQGGASMGTRTSRALSPGHCPTSARHAHWPAIQALHRPRHSLPPCRRARPGGGHRALASHFGPRPGFCQGWGVQPEADGWAGPGAAGAAAPAAPPAHAAGPLPQGLPGPAHRWAGGGGDRSGGSGCGAGNFAIQPPLCISPPLRSP